VQLVIGNPYLNPKMEITTMAQMTERMQELFNKVRNVVLSTATGNGTPNAVPIGAKKIIDAETILYLISTSTKPWQT